MNRPYHMRPRPHWILRFRLAAVLLAVVIVAGTAGYVTIEGWGVHDALFMTITTIATVGYGEVRPLSREGEWFTIGLIIGGVGTMLYGFGVFADLLNDDEVVARRRKQRMQRELAGLRDHFIVCGYGRMGTQIVKEFERARMAYVVIEINAEALGRLQHEGRLYIEADATSEEGLRAAGIDRARGLISAVDADERAVYITLTARWLNPRLYILSRAGHPESTLRLKLAGADRIVSPYQMAGHHLAELALRPALIDVMETIHHGGAEIGVDEFLVADGCAALGKSLVVAGLLSDGGAQLLAVRREDGSLHVNPEGHLIVAHGDLIVALGSAEQLARTATLLQ